MKFSLLKSILLSFTILLFVNMVFSQQAILDEGKKLYEQKKFKEAIAVFLKASKQQYTKKKPQTWHYLGLSYFSSKNYEKSTYALKKAAKYDKRNSDIWNDLGLAYLQISQIKKAGKTFERAIKYNPQVAAYRSNLAYVYLTIGKYDKAQSESEEAIRLDSKNANAHYIRGVTYVWESEFDKAIADADIAIKFDNKNALAYFLKVDALLYKYGGNWAGYSEPTEGLGLLRTASDSLEECVRNCYNLDKMKARQKLNAINTFYKYFSKKKEPKIKNTTGIRILTKPLPVYTNEARQAGTRGKVVVAVLFGASSRVEAVLVLKGLPNGLTEVAIRAANKIQFVPPKRDGKSISTVKKVVYNFNVD